VGFEKQLVTSTRTDPPPKNTIPIVKTWRRLSPVAVTGNDAGHKNATVPKSF
jgi:hypothetical protein